MAPKLAQFDFVNKMTGIAERWGDLAGVLKIQSELETCRAELFGEAGQIIDDLADREETLFKEVASAATNESLWSGVGSATP